MDLDAILARKPRLALVDELAHTNVPGSRHAKRCQDVEELLDAGIDVYHHDQHPAPGKPQRRRRTASPACACARPCPTACFDGRRDRAGRPAARRADRAAAARARSTSPNRRAGPLEHFFSTGNLTALRELALRDRRRARRRADARLHARARDPGGRGRRGERILVCDRRTRQSDIRLRAARQRRGERRRRRGSRSMSRPPRHAAAGGNEDSYRRRLAARRGSAPKPLVLHGDSVVGGTAGPRAAAQHQPDHRRPHPRAAAGAHVLPHLCPSSCSSAAPQLRTDHRHHAEDERRTAPRSWRPPGRARSTGAATRCATRRDRGGDGAGYGLSLERWIAPNDLSLIYLMAVLLVAIATGWGRPIAASVASFLAYNFFFTDPLFTLRHRVSRTS